MKKVVAAHLLLLILVACSNVVQPTPTATVPPTLAATVTLTPSPLPPTETREVQPVSEWNGIPIMPGARAGEGDEEGYVFTRKATSAQVQEYYQHELSKIGWQVFSQEASGSSLMLIFMNSASATLTVNIISKGDEVLVILLN